VAVRQNTRVLEFYHRLVRAYVGLGWAAGLALAVVVPTLTFLFGVAVVLWLPSDYFVRGIAATEHAKDPMGTLGGFPYPPAMVRGERSSPAPHAYDFWQRHRVVRVTVRILKNALGWFMVPLGIFMALPLVPGPGLVFILIGISLLDFPGKRHLEERLLAYPPVLHAVNRMRQRFGRSPVLVHPHGSASGKGESPARDEPPASGG
jgi:hypothetical protein